MQTITDDLKALLRSRFQAGASGFRGRVEVDIPIPDSFGEPYSGTAWAGSIAYGKTVTAYSSHGSPANPAQVTDGSASTGDYYAAGVYSGTFYRGWEIDLGQVIQVTAVTIAHDPGAGSGTLGHVPTDLSYSEDGSSWTVAGSVFGTVDSPQTWANPYPFPKQRTYTPGSPFEARYLRIYESYTASGYTQGCNLVEALVRGSSLVSGQIQTIGIRASRIAADKSLRVEADQVEVVLPNESLTFGWGSETLLATNSRIRCYQWYGDQANEVRSFTGVIDDVLDHRDPLTTTIKARDMMAILLDQTFGATAPQGADEDGAVRTADNGVYLSMEVSAIVTDILDRAGWPADDRAITETSYVLDEFIIPDGMSWAAAITGTDNADSLAGLVGYSAWADEAGVFHFAPSYAAGALTDPPVPDYSYVVGDASVDPLTSSHVLSLDRETDQYDLRTRVKIRGPLTTQTLTDTWRELWRTHKFARPVGIWYDPSDSANIRVIDRSTKKLYKLRQSDRVILSAVNLGSVIAYPLGISGDPSDATIYWVLNGPWVYGGGGSSSIKKVRKSDNHVLATYTLDSDHWSAIKVSGSYIYATNLSTDRVYRRSKADGSAVDDFRHTYNSTLQSNPSGLMIDGTTLHVFWANGGSTARFLVCDESDPSTITKVVKTAGTALHGGEMDTTTHTECWGDADDLGLVAKFTLVDVSSQTDEVYAEAVDTDLEDELGLLAQSEPRSHDTHPGDADHPYEIRRDTLDVTVVTSLAQATETALRRLELLARRREVLDVGIIGNPALQKTDLIYVEDPLTGAARTWQIDTYRSDLDAEGSYVGTLALLPVDEGDETIADDGSATE